MAGDATFWSTGILVRGTRPGRALAQEALSALRGVDVWRVRVRNKAPQLTISLPVPAAETRVPLPVFPLVPQLAEMILARGDADRP